MTSSLVGGARRRTRHAYCIGRAWLKIAVQQSEIAIPSPLFIRVSVSVRRMWRASFISGVVLFSASSNTLISSHSTWMVVLQSPISPALLFWYMWPPCVLSSWSRGLSSFHLCRHGHNCTGLGIRRWTSFTRTNCPRRVDDDRKTVLMSYRLHTRLTSSLSPE